MNTQHNMEERLWEYIDGVCTTEEKRRVEQLLIEQKDWQEKFRELKELHALMMSSETEQPSMRFTKNVMEEIAKYKIAPATRTYVNKKIIIGIASFFIIVLSAFLIYTFTQVNWSDGSSTPLPVDLDKVNVDWSKYFNSTTLNIFFMLDAVLGLFLLDRYLIKRRQQMKARQA